MCLESLLARQGVLSYNPSSRKASLIPIASSLPFAFGSLLSVCSLLALVPEETQLEGKDLSQLPPQSPGVVSTAWVFHLCI